jgi:hypothetical protein
MPMLRFFILFLGLLTGSLNPAMATYSVADRDGFNEEELTSGFYKTVFGVEYPQFGGSGDYVKKYTGPIRVYVHNMARKNRKPVIAQFVGILDRNVRGLDIQLSQSPENANYEIYVVDRAQYQNVLRNTIFQNTPPPVRGRCMVRVMSNYLGITKSQAVIVSDEGEFLFRRCMVEEILQGLGPLNDNPTLPWSVFNDRSPHSSFMKHDRYILNMLYHPKIKAGMSPDRVRYVMPRVLEDVSRYVR